MVGVEGGEVDAGKPNGIEEDVDARDQPVLQKRCKAKPPKPPAPLPHAGRITAEVPVGRGASTLAVGFGSLWVGNASDGTVSRVDPSTNALLATIPVGHGPGQIAAGAGAVWTANSADSTVSRIDPATNQVVATFKPAGADPDPAVDGVGSSDGAVWVTGHHSGIVYRIDPVTDATIATITTTHAGVGGPSGVIIGMGSIWTSIPNSDSIVRIDPATDAVVATIAVPCVGERGLIDGNVLWIVSRCDGTKGVTRIDATSNTVLGRVGNNSPTDRPNGISSGFGSIWAATPAGIVVRIDPQANRILGTLLLPEAGDPNIDIAVTSGALWVSDSDKLLRIAPAP